MLISHLVAQAVVDVLEIVQVEDRDRKLQLLALRDPLILSCQHLRKRELVLDACHRVSVREPLRGDQVFPLAFFCFKQSLQLFLIRLLFVDEDEGVEQAGPQQIPGGIQRKQRIPQLDREKKRHRQPTQSDGPIPLSRAIF